jgi:methylmalonyl-CoA mutase
MTDAFPLAAGFPDPDLDAWRDLATKALRGAPFERLIETTHDGIAIKPLYVAADVPAAPARPRLPVRDPFLPWDIRQAFADADPARLNADILTDLKGGVSSIEVRVGQGGARPSLAIADLEAALAGVDLDIAPVALNVGPQSALDAVRALDAMLTRAGADPAKARPAFNLTFVTPWLARGGLPRPFEALMADAAAFAVEVAGRWPRATALCAAGRGAHEAGAGVALEIATMLAEGVAHLRALEVAGLPPAQGAPLIALRLAAGQDVVVELAKMRAARLLWSRVLEACGAPDAPASLQAVTSLRMLARNDAWTNILRVTCATFAAAAGGADVITASPLTAPLGAPSPLARKIARNTQIVLMEETRLGHVADPGAGAFAVEALTADIAEAAWAAFQAIEARGGVAGALRSGWLQAEIGRNAAAQSRDAARRKRPITGVSNQPLLGETPPDFRDEGPAPPPSPMPADPIPALPWNRLAEPFEALRAAGEAAGSPPVFFANLGALPQFSARAGFARNLLGVGGLSTPDSERVWPDADAMVAGFRASGAKVAVLCSSDALYAEAAAPAAVALKAAGARWLVLAGKPADEAALRAAGVDQFIFAGQDALEALGAIHAALGIGA